MDFIWRFKHIIMFATTGIVQQHPRHYMDLSSGFNSVISYGLTFPIDNDNKYYFGYNAFTYKGTNVYYFGRLHADGTLDTSWNAGGTGFNNQTQATVCFDYKNRKIYTGGMFTTYNGSSIPYGMFKSDFYGTRETFNGSNAGFNNLVATIAIRSDDKTYWGGRFTTYNSATNNRIILLNTDGSKDTSFDNSTGFNNPVLAILLDSNEKIYVVGDFASYKGTTANRIIRLNADGSKDTGFNNSGGFDTGTAFSLALDKNGKLYVGGSFTSYKGTTANRIIRLNADGSKDTGFNNSGGFDTGTIMGIAYDYDLDKIYCSGSFGSYNGSACQGICRLNNDGTKDSSFVAATTTTGNAYGCYLDMNGDIVQYGLTTYGGVTYYHVIKFDRNGTIMKI